MQSMDSEVERLRNLVAILKDSGQRLEQENSALRALLQRAQLQNPERARSLSLPVPDGLSVGESSTQSFSTSAAAAGAEPVEVFNMDPMELVLMPGFVSAPDQPQPSVDLPSAPPQMLPRYALGGPQ